MEQQYLNQKSYSISDEILYTCLFDSIMQACRMIAPTSEEKHARIIWETIKPMIRKFYNDFTANQLSSAIQSGAYGYYGAFTKVNGAVINEWFRKKREEVSKEYEEKERSEARSKRDKHVLAEANGGHACILMLYYHERGLPEVPREQRLKLVNENGICPNTGKRISELIGSYLKSKYK